MAESECSVFYPEYLNNNNSRPRTADARNVVAEVLSLHRRMNREINVLLRRSVKNTTFHSLEKITT